MDRDHQLRLGRSWVALLVCFVANYCVAQSGFSVLPQLQEPLNHGSAFILIPGNSNFKVIGDFIDESQDLAASRLPYIATFSNKGSLLSISPLIDSNYTMPFVVEHFSSIKKDDESFYCYAYRDVGGEFLRSYLIEIELGNESIRRGVIIEPTTDTDFPGLAMTYNGSSEIAVVNAMWQGDTNSIHITRLDTLFNVLSTFEVHGNVMPENTTIPHYVEYTANYELTMVGETRRNGVAGFDTADLFILRVDTFGNIIHSSIVPTPVHLRLAYASSYTILRDAESNWIISAGELLGIDGCTTCRKYVPYIVSIDPEFDTINWITRFLDEPIAPSFQNFVYSNTECSDGYISSGFRISSTPESYPQSAFLFKASKSGDSLWTKYYVPLGWEASRVGLIQFFDIKVTSNDELLIAGRVFDKENNLVRPWLLRVDKDGCVVSGCDSSVALAELPARKYNYFDVYPNPSFDNITLVGLHDVSNPVEVTITNSIGTLVHKTTVNRVGKGEVLAFSLSNQPRGVYYISLTSTKEGIFELHEVILL